MTYTLRSLARVTYHGGLPLTAPLACDVADAAGVLHRAEYVDNSLIARAIWPPYALLPKVRELYRQGLTYVAIADALGIPRGTLRSIVAHARKTGRWPKRLWRVMSRLKSKDRNTA